MKPATDHVEIDFITLLLAVAVDIAMIAIIGIVAVLAYGSPIR